VSNSFDPPSALAQSRIERTVPRYMFLGVGEITDTASRKCIVGTVTEISRKGCYVDTGAPLPTGTPLSVVISAEGTSFATGGKVIYSRGEGGIGVAFLDPAGDQLAVLDSWLCGLRSITTV
jgi:hypothetical protein